MITYLQAIVLGILQGLSEIFPVSSLGHSVLFAELFGWYGLLNQVTADKSNFLSFLAALRVGTAIALLVFYRHTWSRIFRRLVNSLRSKTISSDSDTRLAKLLIVALIPTGIMALIFGHFIRTQFATSFFAIVFIIINGIILIKYDKIVQLAQTFRPRRRRIEAEGLATNKTNQMISDHIDFRRATYIGVMQTGALFAGFSRSGITMIAGLRSGLSRRDAASFSFLLITPIVLMSGLLGLPALFSSSGTGLIGPTLIGAALAGIAAYLSVRFLDKYLESHTLRPFGYYCVSLGGLVLLISIIRGAR